MGEGNSRKPVFGFRLSREGLFCKGLKQTAAQLAAAYKCSSKTICHHLKKAAPQAQFTTPKCVNIVMDTTYFGRTFGVMVLMDSISGKALSVSEVKNETNALYAQAIGSLKAKDIEIQSIVCDGRRGLAQMFPDIPVKKPNFASITGMMICTKYC